MYMKKRLAQSWIHWILWWTYFDFCWTEISPKAYIDQLRRCVGNCTGQRLNTERLCVQLPVTKRIKHPDFTLLPVHSISPPIHSNVWDKGCNCISPFSVLYLVSVRDVYGKPHIFLRQFVFTSQSSDCRSCYPVRIFFHIERWPVIHLQWQKKLILYFDHLCTVATEFFKTCLSCFLKFMASSSSCNLTIKQIFFTAWRLICFSSLSRETHSLKLVRNSENSALFVLIHFLHIDIRGQIFKKRENCAAFFKGIKFAPHFN